MTSPWAPVAATRRMLWRAVLASTGGLRVVGTPPRRPCVLVANHASHADTAALLAALSARRRPGVLAAADYWFDRPTRALICRSLAGAVPIRRHGGGGDLAPARALIATGRDVIVFPEGTRSRDGSVGTFHSGALRLATDAGVALVPVGIAGTRALLPAGGRLRRAPVQVRFGSPLPDQIDVTGAREAVVRLVSVTRHRASRRAPARGGARREAPDSTLRRRAARFAGTRWGVATVAAWSFAEAVCWPLVPEFVLAILVVAAPRRAVRLAAVAVAASLAGGAVAYALGWYAVPVPTPLTTPLMHASAVTATAADGTAAVLGQPNSGVPYKVYALAAGQAHVDLAGFLGASLVGRGSRIALIGGCLGLSGAATSRWRRWYPQYLAVFVTIFAAGLAAVVQSWS